VTSRIGVRIPHRRMSDWKPFAGVDSMNRKGIVSGAV